MINVLYSFDNNYFRHAFISMISLKKQNENVRLYLITKDLDEQNKNKLIKTFGIFNLKFIDNDLILKNIEIKTSSKYPISAYSRLFIEDYIDEEKIIYIDCDTIVNGSIKELFDIDLRDFYVGAVQDTPRFYSLEEIGLNHNSRYVNSGVLLINLKLWKQNCIKKKFINYIDKFFGCVPHEDQGIINGVLSDKIMIVDPKFNVMPQFFYLSSKRIKKLCKINNFYDDELLYQACKEPVIIHYLGLFYGRPWTRNCTHPYKEKYVCISEQLGFKIIDGDINFKTKLQKFWYFHFPFFSYCILEDFLDIKRIKALRKERGEK